MSAKNANILLCAVVVAVNEHEKTETIAKATRHFLMPASPYSEHLLLRRSKHHIFPSNSLFEGFLIFHYLVELFSGGGRIEKTNKVAMLSFLCYTYT